MEKIHIDVNDLPMLKKELIRLREIDMEKEDDADLKIRPIMHIDNFVDIYEDMLTLSIYEKEKPLIEQELKELKEEISNRNNENLLGEIFHLDDIL